MWLSRLIGVFAGRTGYFIGFVMADGSLTTTVSLTRVWEIFFLEFLHQNLLVLLELFCSSGPIWYGPRLNTELYYILSERNSPNVVSYSHINLLVRHDETTGMRVKCVCGWGGGGEGEGGGEGGQPHIEIRNAIFVANNI